MFDVKQALRLCLLIGPSQVAGDWLALIKQAIAGGVTSLQLRDKTLDAKGVAYYAKQLKKALPSGFPLVINDHVEVAAELGLALHIGQGDCSYQSARERLGEQAIIGLSIENEQQAKACRENDADYFGVGPVFATGSKPDAAPAVGVERTHSICQQLAPAPCVLIGGVGLNNVSLLQGVAHGVAVISAITQSADPKLAARQLRRGLNNEAVE